MATTRIQVGRAKDVVVWEVEEEEVAVLREEVVEEDVEHRMDTREDMHLRLLLRRLRRQGKALHVHLSILVGRTKGQKVVAALLGPIISIINNIAMVAVVAR